jgi:hypothetical protein
MAAKRLLVVALVATIVIAVATPAFAKGETRFVVSGGDLKRPFSIDSSSYPFSSQTGQWWHYGSRVPALNGERYHLALYDEYDNKLMSEWEYVPASLGALPLTPSNAAARADDGGPIRWVAFSPTFNSAFLRAIKAGPTSPYGTLAIVLGLLMLLTGAGLFLRAPGRPLIGQFRKAPVSTWA